MSIWQHNQVNHHMQFKVDENRRLFIKKDILDVSQWTDDLESKNDDISTFNILNRHLVKCEKIQNVILDFRRRNTLIMAALCKYEQSLRHELEYGDIAYDVQRAKIHEKKRAEYLNFIKDYRDLKSSIYNQLIQYKRK